MEIVHGIHKIGGVSGANCYLVINASGIMVVDTGLPGNAQAIAAYVMKLGKKLTDVGSIVLTHADIDHSGSAAELKDITGAHLAVHEADAAVLRGEAQKKRPAGVLSPLFGLMRLIMRSRKVTPDTLLKDGDMIGGYKVIYSPGHTSGSISLYDLHDIIFVGDALKSDAKGNPLLPSRLLSMDIVQAMDSVKRISNLEFSVLLTGHGAPVVKDASSKVKALLV